jgi:aryl-alcohol dehydrogenase-like predicted oxidoreductase
MRYRVFGRTGLRVSQLALGTGNFGTGWGYGSSREEASAIFDGYRAAGGNFIDTADQYQFGQSETMLGEFIASDRDDVVVATKFAIGADPTAGLQATGNSRRAMVQCVEASLRRLRTDRIDLLWAHFPDFVTGMDEIARGFEDLVRQGKILYPGLSNFPAWRTSAAVTLAEARGWVPVSAIQTEYSLVERSAERDLIPMARAFDLGVIGWSPLGGGLLTGKYRRGETGRKEGLGVVIQVEDDVRKTAVLDELADVATDLGTSQGHAAIAWVLSKGVLPIIGPRTPAQLADNLAAAEVTLSAEQIARLDAAGRVPLGAPHEFADSPGTRDRLAGGQAAQLDLPARPIR